jgi:nucleoside-diphosphate-sugar epimerase
VREERLISPQYTTLFASMASSKPLVLLTGGNGFVGAHVLDHLLSADYRVRSTVRSAEKAHFIEKKYADRKATCPSSSSPIFKLLELWTKLS